MLELSWWMMNLVWAYVISLKESCCDLKSYLKEERTLEISNDLYVNWMIEENMVDLNKMKDWI